MRRLRVIAGPNGSGKSIIFKYFKPHWIGVYVNADQIQASFERQGGLDLHEFDISLEEDALRAYLRDSGRIEDPARADFFRINANQILCDGHVTAADAGAIADYLRLRLVHEGKNLTTETVMSSSHMLNYMAQARAAGYLVYLYFVSTADPDINVKRVAARVQQGGHPVDEDTIRKRYPRCLNLLPQALKSSDKAWVYDNSGSDPLLLATMAYGVLSLEVEYVPMWFKRSILDRARPAPE